MDDDELAAVRQEAGPCPACGADAALPIVYGMVLPDEHERLAGRAVFAGCCVPYDAPRFACGQCDRTWGVRPEPQLVAWPSERRARRGRAARDR